MWEWTICSFKELINGQIIVEVGILKHIKYKG